MWAPPHSPNRVSRPGGQESWFRIENKDTGAASIYIYDEIGFWGVTAQDFAAELDNVDASTMDVHINSPGGEVYDGIAIYNAIKQHKAIVTTRVDGCALSAASFIFQAGDTRIVARNAEIMIHDAMGAVFGNAAEMADMVRNLERISNNIADIYATRSGADTCEVWRERMRAETWYTAREAVAAGLADQMTDDDAVDGPTVAWGGLFRYRNRQAAPPPRAAGRGLPIPTPDPSPEPDPLPATPLFSVDPDLFRAAMQLGIDDFTATAPPLQTPAPAVPATPAVPAFPADIMRQAIKEGTA